MELARSAHTDTFTRDNLPPRELWPELVFDLPELRYPERLNCAVELLDDAIAEGYAGKPAILCGEETLTYGQAFERANRAARVLVEDYGLAPGNRVLLRGPNSAETFIAWFAIVKAGGVVVSTMPLLRAVELRQIIAKGEISLALCDATLLKELEDAQLDSPQLKQIISYGAAEADLERASAGKPSTFTAVDTAADDVALLAFTSGTTGQPKATMHFHRDVLAMCDAFCRHIVRPKPEDVFIGTPPIAFTFGLGGVLAFPFRFRATTALPIGAGPPATAEAVQRHKATTLFTSPTAYRAMLGKLGDYDLSSLHTCVSAGEPLPRSTSDAWFDATGLRIIDGIGSTEMIHIFISARGEDIRPGATGKPVPGYRATLLDDDDNPFEGPGVGRLAVKGPTGCRYLADARQTNYVVKGWNVTGDRYRRDEDGYYWFEARADDMIVTSGYNVGAPEVEDALLAHAEVAECAVVASPCDERGHIVKAFVVLRDGSRAGPAMVEELQSFVKARIAPYKYPRAVEFVTALPKTQTGKLQRFQLRKLEEERARASAA